MLIYSIIVTLLYLFLSNQSATLSLIYSIIKSKVVNRNISIYDYPAYNEILIAKARLSKLSHLKIYETDTFYGFMFGLPSKPIMALSEKAISEFNNDEMEWLLLHESAHYRLWHSARLALIQVVLLLIGNLLSFNFIYPILISIIFAVITLQIAKYHEVEANKFAVKLISNPNAMLTAGEKLLNNKNLKSQLSNVYSKIFGVWDKSLCLKQIKLAKQELLYRNK